MGKTKKEINGNNIMEKLTVLIEPDQLACLTEEVAEGRYKNISEVARAAIREHNEFGKDLDSLEMLKVLYQQRDLSSAKELVGYIIGLEQKIIKNYGKD